MDLGFISSDEFLVKDIQGEGFRHIVFATRYQLELLAKTKVWYMDGTFKVIFEMNYICSLVIAVSLPLLMMS